MTTFSQWIASDAFFKFRRQPSPNWHHAILLMLIDPAWSKITRDALPNLEAYRVAEKLGLAVTPHLGVTT